MVPINTLTTIIIHQNSNQQYRSEEACKRINPTKHKQKKKVSKSFFLIN